MQIWQAIVLGAVQGFTEFLPVSSSGHLMLLGHWFGIEGNAFFYTMMLHLGTLIPVVFVLWKEIFSTLKPPFKKFWFWVLATIPAGITGLTVSLLDVDKVFSENIWLLGITFFITAGELIFAEMYSKKKQMINPINAKTAFIMGCGQAVGVLPGLSRSGNTITGGVLAKVEKNKNASFTFLMSIPVIVIAALLEGVKIVTDGGASSIDVVPLLFGMITAMITGYIAIKFMLGIIRKANYKWFSLYLVLLSISVLVSNLAFGV